MVGKKKAYHLPRGIPSPSAAISSSPCDLGESGISQTKGSEGERRYKLVLCLHRGTRDRGTARLGVLRQVLDHRLVPSQRSVSTLGAVFNVCLYLSVYYAVGSQMFSMLDTILLHLLITLPFIINSFVIKTFWVLLASAKVPRTRYHISLPHTPITQRDTRYPPVLDTHFVL